MTDIGVHIGICHTTTWYGDIRGNSFEHHAPCCKLVHQRTSRVAVTYAPPILTCADLTGIPGILVTVFFAPQGYRDGTFGWVVMAVARITPSGSYHHGASFRLRYILVGSEWQTNRLHLGSELYTPLQSEQRNVKAKLVWISFLIIGMPSCFRDWEVLKVLTMGNAVITWGCSVKVTEYHASSADN